MWLEWIDKGNTIPVPFNTVYYILYIFLPNFWKTCYNNRRENVKGGDGNKRKARMKVMNGLVVEYLIDRYEDKWKEPTVKTGATRP